MTDQQRNRLSAELALQSHNLRQLEVVEMAESVVRQCHLHLFTEVLTGAARSLQEATQELAVRRSGGDHLAIIASEERLCSATQRIDAFLAQYSEEAHACRQAVERCDADRLLISRRIEYLQFMIYHGKARTICQDNHR